MEDCINRCPHGYGLCTCKYYLEKCKCTEGYDPGNSGCAYAHGNALYPSMIHKDGYVHIRCHNCECEMDPWQYTSWNGLCGLNADSDWQYVTV